MKHNYNHIDSNSDPVKTPDDFFGKLEVRYEKSREDAWSELDARLSEKPATRLFAFSSHKLSFGIAAAVLLLAGIFSLLRFYTTAVYCPPGQHLSYILPDHSSVEMNADSRMTFQPLWWWYSREIKFEGEGFFEVEKGQKFEVISETGRTEVLGTSFNIYSRDREYKVNCITGKVKVISLTSEEVILSPEYEAKINSEGNIEVRKETKTGVSKAWVNNMFNFTARSLAQVFDEIGRQYDVTVVYKALPDYSYTGYFSKDRTVEEVLTLVCKPFGLTFVRISEKKYEIFQN